MSEWHSVKVQLPPISDAEYHEFWSRRDERRKEKMVVYRQFGRRYFVKIDRKSGVFKTESEILGEFPTLFLALQHVVNHAALSLPIDWGERKSPIAGYAAPSTGLEAAGIPYSELTPPDGVPGVIYVNAEMDAWRKLLKRAAKQVRSSKKDERGELWDHDYVAHLSYLCWQADLVHQQAALRSRLAQLGHPHEQYLKGRGAEESEKLEKAHRWYKKAAASGHSDARAALERLEDEITRGAIEGNSYMQYVKGRWAQDSGDLDAACEWYQRASVAGQKDAAAALGEINGKSTDA